MTDEKKCLLINGTTIPIVFDFLFRRLDASVLGRYPRAVATALIFSFVFILILGLSFNARETVDAEIFNSLAMS